MKSKNKSLEFTIAAWLILGIGAPLVRQFGQKILPEEYLSLVTNLIVLLIAIYLNSKFFKVPIRWQNRHNFKSQLITCLPALIFILLLVDIWHWQLGSLFFVNLLNLFLSAVSNIFIIYGLILTLVEQANPDKPYRAVVVSTIAFGLTNIYILSISYGSGVFLMSVIEKIILSMAFSVLLATVYLKTHHLNLVIALQMMYLAPRILNELSVPLTSNTFTLAYLIIAIFYFIFLTQVVNSATDFITLKIVMNSAVLLICLFVSYQQFKPKKMPPK
ncbi:hypothetical protein [Xylocopilactobacillus apicola]|uniref:Uncharacterized protein n=1 Tax=Xylocopilactobacillus apicola TaxID=2932184 RepID=A0AAU9DZ19_9LACO|nr:hypothetical protein [Xylocopilactobacillus apicola]BDR59478.1 hypothetical protein XA3_19190 [Xylocopilactobacillus apicola]